MSNNSPDKLTGYNSHAHAKVLRLAEVNQHKLDAYPLEALLAMVAAGRTQTEIAKAVGCTQPSVSVFLSSQVGDIAEQVALARRLGGESCLDRGLEELEKARGGDNSVVALARAFEAHFARRAGLFDRSLHDKGEQVQPITPLQNPSFSITILPCNSNGAAPGVVIEHGETIDIINQPSPLNS